MRLRAVIAMERGSTIARHASLLLLLACACPGSSADPAGSAEGKVSSRLDVPAPAKATEEPPAFDPATCDRALKHARKCVDDSTLDTDTKLKLVSTVVNLSDLWAVRAGLPPERQQVQCKRILDGVTPIIRQTGCADLPDAQRTIEP